VYVGCVCVWVCVLVPHLCVRVHATLRWGATQTHSTSHCMCALKLYMLWCAQIHCVCACVPSLFTCVCV